MIGSSVTLNESVIRIPSVFMHYCMHGMWVDGVSMAMGDYECTKMKLGGEGK